MWRGVGAGLCFLASNLIDTSQTSAEARPHDSCSTVTSAVKRLQCYDGMKDSGVVPYPKECFGLTSELHRLDCYDKAQVHAERMTRSKSSTVAGVTKRSRNSAEPVRAQSDSERAPLSSEEISQNFPWRFEVGGGLMHWMLNTALKDTGPNSQSSVNWYNAVGGMGPIWHAGLSYDGLLFDSLSLGVEYVGLSTEANARGSFAGSVGFFALSAKARLEVEARADFLLFNVGRRTLLSSDTSLLAGVGIGPGHATLSGDVVQTMPFSSGPSQTAFELSDWTYGAHAFVALEHNLTERLYLTSRIRYLLSSGYPFGQNMHFQSLASTIALGARF